MKQNDFIRPRRLWLLLYSLLLLMPSAVRAADYGISVAGVTVTSDNASNVLGDDYASVSYDAATGTLTLKGASLVGGIVADNTIDALTVHLIGYNQLSNAEAAAIELAASAVLTFTTSTVLPGLLELSGTLPEATIQYDNGLALSDNVIQVPQDDLTSVAYFTGATSYVNTDNGDNSYIYSRNMEFYASYATGSGYMVVVSPQSGETATSMWPSNLDASQLDKVTVQFDWGTCTNQNVTVQVRGLKQNEETYEMESDGMVYSEAVSLSTADADGIIELPLTERVTSESLELYFSSTATFSLVPLTFAFTNIEPYGIKVTGIAVSEVNAGDVLGDGTVSFNASTNTLTLQDAYLQIKDVVPFVESSLESLTVHLGGSNYVQYEVGESGLVPFVSSNTTAMLTFTTDDDTRLQLLNVSAPDDAISTYFSGFAEVSYDGYLYHQDGRIKNLLPPFLYANSYDDALLVGLTNGNYNDEVVMHYAIDYADAALTDVEGTWDSTKTDEENNIVLANPCTVTAWSEYAGKQSANQVGKLFGLSQTQVNAVLGQTEAALPAVIPAIGESDGISVSYIAEDETIATEADGTLLLGDAAGSTTVEVSLQYDGEPPYSVLNSDGQVGTFLVTVAGVELNVSYAQNTLDWATYCATEQSLETPDGLQAYIVTGVSSKTLTVQAVDYIPQGVGVLLQRTSEVEEPLTARVYQGTEGTFDSNLLTGTAGRTDVSSLEGTVYVLYNGEFVKTLKGYVPANRAYLALSDAAVGARLSIHFNDMTTSVSELVRPAAACWYTIDGRRLDRRPAGKGIYIYYYNGKKAIIQ